MRQEFLFDPGDNMVIAIALLTVAAVLGVFAVAIWIDAPVP